SACTTRGRLGFMASCEKLTGAGRQQRHRDRCNILAVSADLKPLTLRRPTIAPGRRVNDPYEVQPHGRMLLAGFDMASRKKNPTAMGGRAKDRPAGVLGRCWRAGLILSWPSAPQIYLCESLEKIQYACVLFAPAPHRPVAGSPAPSRARI